MNRILAALVLLLIATSPVWAVQKQRPVCRDAKTGAFVSHAYAKKYPGLTVCETKTDLVKQKKQG